ncbi:acyl-CoA carboxylase subunit epsilon, partial [Streptomyces muensis]
MNTPDIRVEKGHAEPEEVAAITAILLARSLIHIPSPRDLL